MIQRTFVRFSNMGNDGKNDQTQWLRFVQIMQASRKSPAELLRHPGAPTDLRSHDISQFKQVMGKRPKFNQLPWLSMALGKDPNYLARELGMAPQSTDDLISERVTAIRHLEELQEQSLAIEQVIHRKSSDVLAAIVARANETGHWAVAVWPAVEGPEDCKLHVSDRIDFIRSDGLPSNAEDLWDEMGDILTRSNAIRARPQPRWSKNPQLGLSWSIQTALDTTTPTLATPYPNLRSVSVVSQTVAAWGSNTASNIAVILGYGLDSSRAMKVRIYGGARNGRPMDQSIGEDVPAIRAQIHGNHLQEPKSRFVWCHFGDVRDGKPFYPDPSSRWPTGHFLIRLRESDQLLEWASRNEDDRVLNSAIQNREIVDRRWNEIPEGAGITINVDHPWKSTAPQPTAEERRNYRSLEALNTAADALESMLDRGLIPPAAIEARLAILRKSHSTPNENAISKWMRRHERLTYRTRL